MKKLLSLFMCIILCAAAGCGDVNDADEKKKLAPRADLLECDEYDRGVYLKPLWYTREVYNETVLFVGLEDEAPLLYPVSEIVSVRSYGLDVTYAEGEDYIVEDGKLKRTADSSMPYMEIDEYYRTTPDPRVEIALTAKALSEHGFSGRRYLAYGESDTFTSRQVAVTYRHDAPYDGPVPAGKSEKFKNFFDKLEAGEKPTVHFYGDSITVGCNASGTEYGGNVSPYAETWSRMTTGWLEDNYKKKVKYINTAYGGYSTADALSHFEKDVLAYESDLLVLAFGMNDGGLDPYEYRFAHESLIQRYREKNPSSEVLFVSPMLPNIESDWLMNQGKYAAELLELEKEYDFVGVADVTEMHEYFLSAGKRYRDFTGNNVNHPNDFIIRLYAQTVLKTLAGDDFCLEKWTAK